MQSIQHNVWIIQVGQHGNLLLHRVNRLHSAEQCRGGSRVVGGVTVVSFFFFSVCWAALLRLACPRALGLFIETQHRLYGEGRAEQSWLILMSRYQNSTLDTKFNIQIFEACLQQISQWTRASSAVRPCQSHRHTDGLYWAAELQIWPWFLCKDSNFLHHF